GIGAGSKRPKNGLQMSYHFVVRTSPVAQKRRALLRVRQTLFAALYGTKPVPSSAVSLRPICGRSSHNYDFLRNLRRVCVESTCRDSKLSRKSHGSYRERQYRTEQWIPD